MQQTPAPWMLKPRTDASAIGIRKLHNPEELWPLLDQLGDRSRITCWSASSPATSSMPKASPGTAARSPLQSHQYGKPPFQTHASGRRLHHATRWTAPLCRPRMIRELHQQLIAALGLANGVTHTECIRSSR